MHILQLLLILKARRKLILLSLGVSVIVISAVSLLMPKVYTAAASLVVNGRGADPLTGKDMQGQFGSAYLATQVDIISSHNVALKVVDELRLSEDPALQRQFQSRVETNIPFRDWLADSLLGSLAVKPSNQSSVLYISYKSADPQLAARLANAFVKAYIQTNLELKTQPSKQTADWYNARLGELRDDLERAQAKLSKYQQTKGIVSLDDKLDVESARLVELSSQLVAAQGQTYDSVSIERNASNASHSVVNNPLIQSLKADLAKSEAKLSQLSRHVGENHPDFERAASEVSSLRDKLNSESNVARQSMSSDLNVARQREGQLRAAVVAQKEKVLALNAQRDVGAVLAREVESAQRIYDQALERFGQTRLEGHAGQTEIAVLSSAVPPLEPSTPNIGFNVMLSIGFGLLLGVGLALVTEMLNRRVRSEYDAISMLGAPVLGVLVAHDRPRLGLRERLGLPSPRPI